MNFLSKLKSVLGVRTNIFGGSFVWNLSDPNGWTQEQLYKQYTRYVHSIISQISRDVAKLEPTFENKAKGKWVTDDTNAILKLINTPNDQQSKFQFFELLQTYLEIQGEVFIYTLPAKKTRQPTAFHLIRPDRMEVAFQTTGVGKVTGYVLNLGDEKKIPFEIHEIIHIKLPNPENPYRGLSPIRAAMDYIQTEEFTTNWTKKTIFNSGRPSGIVNFKGTINNEDFQAIKRRFQQEYGGIKNAGKTMFVRSDEVGFKKIGVELGDIALKDIKNMSRDDIMAMWQMSKTMLGIAEDVNKSVASEAHSVYIESLIKPRIFRIIDEFNRFLLPVYKLDRTTNRIGFVDPNPETMADKVLVWEKGHNKWLATNDIRREIGLNPVPGGDFIYQPISNVPLDSTPLSLPTKGITKDSKKKTFLDLK